MAVTWSIDFGTGKIVSSEGAHIATMRPTCVTGEWEADAYLIAGAPALLRAAKLISGFAVSWEPLTPGDIAELNAAIAKAEGK